MDEDNIKIDEETGEEIPQDDPIEIEEDYTELEGATVIIDDGSDLQVDTLYKTAVSEKEQFNNAKDTLKSKILGIIKSGEITANDAQELENLKDQFTESYNIMKGLGNGSEYYTSNTNENITTNYLTVEKMLEVLTRDSNFLYVDDDGQVMLNGEAMPKIKLVEAEIEKLFADYAEINTLVAGKASIEELEAVNAKIENIEVGDIDAVKADIENLKVNKANITDLNATNADIENLKSTKASITDLNAANGKITNLETNLADINTLVNGHLTSDNIQSLHLTVSNTTIDNALIKDAMIDTVSANKLTAGSINTNKVLITSEDGSMTLSGSLQQFKDSEGNVRIQIGKDTSGDFTFALYGADGQGQLINQNGITASAISDGLIVNSMVADDAAIAGSKLDINSVIRTINEDGSETLNSSKVKFSDTNQTLDVAFSNLKTTVDNINTSTGDISGLKEQVETNTTNIGIAQGQISTLIDNTTITKEDGTTTQLKDAYNATVDTVNSHTTKIGSLESNYNKVTGDLESVTSKQATLESDLSGFKTSVSETYTTKTEHSELQEYTDTSISNTENALNANITGAVNDAKKEVLESFNNDYVPNNTFTEYQKVVASSFEQTNSDMEMKFTTSSEGIKQVGDNLEAYKEAVSTNIRFSNDGIEIGKSDSPFDVSITNEKMSFNENGNEVAYISNQEMKITDAVVNTSLRIGKYKFVPRANGNLSFTWVDK